MCHFGIFLLWAMRETGNTLYPPNSSLIWNNPCFLAQMVKGRAQMYFRTMKMSFLERLYQPKC